MGIIDAFGLLAPGWAARWTVARSEFLEARRRYEAAAPDRFRPARSSSGDGDAVVSSAGTRLRGYSRHLDENHDLVIGVFDDLVNNAIGTGIGIDPHVRATSGELHEDCNDQLRRLWADFIEAPETTGQYDFVALERMMARSVMRDGEMFAQQVRSDLYRYRTRVPLVVDLLEADYCPLDYTLADGSVTQGVERDAWGAPRAYYFYRRHPGAMSGPITVQATDLIRKNAAAILHPKLSKRLKQVRGVPALHGVIQRLRDVKDYEESERIAAKVAADITGWVRAGAALSAAPSPGASTRDLRMQAGMILQLNQGEEIGLLKSDRPNPNLENFRSAMLRAVAAGTGTRYSSIARNYSGNYSSQRQELVEGAVGYRALTAYLVGAFHRPLWRTFVEVAYLSGQLKVARGVDLQTLYRADFRAPALPWIDPKKEAEAWALLVDTELESRAGIQRMRGRDADHVHDEIAAERKMGFKKRTPAVDDENESESDQEAA